MATTAKRSQRGAGTGQRQTANGVRTGQLRQRNFVQPKSLVAAAEDVARKANLSLSELLGHGLSVFLAEAVPATPGPGLLSKELVQGVAAVFTSHDEQMQNAYLKALQDRGWPVKAVAAAVVASGAADRMSRQAVVQRISQAPAAAPAGMPTPPAPLKPRHSAAQPSVRMNVLVDPQLIDRAAQRAEYEGVTLPVLLEHVLAGVVDGTLGAPEPARRPAGQAPVISDPASGPMITRTFDVPKPLVDAARAEAEKLGRTVSDVLRHGLDVYIAGTPPEVRQVPPGDKSGLLPKELVQGVGGVFASGNRDLQNSYLKALKDLGWTLDALALAVVASGAAPRMSRQAVYDRIRKAPPAPPAGMPAPPAPRKRREPVPEQEAFRLPLRIHNEHLEQVMRRVTFEGTTMSTVIEDLLDDFVNGRLRLPAQEPSADT